MNLIDERRSFFSFWFGGKVLELTICGAAHRRLVNRLERLSFGADKHDHQGIERESISGTVLINTR